MSEIEIKRRQEYKRNRKKWTMIQIIAIVVLVALSLGSLLVYNSVNRTYHIEYTENSSIDYMVQYNENDFFDDEWMGMNHTYISELTNDVLAEFEYDLCTGSSDMSFDYSYSVDVKLLVASKDSGNPYYVVEENIVPTTHAVADDTSCIKIKETVLIDYDKYNAMAKDFVNTYNLKQANSTLVVTLNVEMLSVGKTYETQSQNKYSTSLNIPLTVDSFSIYSTSSSPANETKVLEYKDAVNQDIFMILAIVFISLAGLVGIGLAVFLRLTVNDDITYAAKIRKILRSYGSFIQRIDGEFEYEGYQIVPIKTFVEMLGIRDTIQSPVLMSENHDETMTRFLIPTATKLLYVFEIKVDNYDEIYNKVEPEAVVEPEVVEEPDVVEEPVILEEVDEELLADAMAQPEVDLDEIEFVPDDDDDFAVAPEEPGIEVVGIVWPERAHRNKVYRYDPNGEQLYEGDVVLVPTKDVTKGKEVLRKVAVAHGNHRVAPEHIKFPLKKVIAVIKRRVTNALVTTPDPAEEINAPKAAKKKNLPKSVEEVKAPEAVEEVKAPETVVEEVEAPEAPEIQYI